MIDDYLEDEWFDQADQPKADRERDQFNLERTAFSERLAKSGERNLAFIDVTAIGLGHATEMENHRNSSR